MIYYVYLDNKIINEKVNKEINDTINRYFGKINEILIDSNCYVLIIKDHLNKNKLNEYFENFIQDNLINLKVYISQNFIEMVDLKEELSIVNEVFKDNNFVSKTRVYNYKKLLEEALITNNTHLVKKKILKRFYNNVEYYQILSTVFNNNLNVLKTARDLDIHRNTLIYKLDLFTSVTSLDPRDFNDAFIIKILIEY